jgi:hypothetical protein
MNEDEKKRFLADVNPEHYFRVANGTVIKGIMELDSSLEGMGNETFEYHVNDYRNDFSTWVRDVIRDEKLANELLVVKDKCKTQLLVLRRILDIMEGRL